MGVRLDAKDLKILAELDMDARQSVTSIAKKVGLSKETTNYRIRQLQEKGVIEGFYAIIDVSKIGYAIHRLMIRFRKTDPEKEKEILDYLKGNKHVGWVVSIHGNWDMAVLFWARNSFEFRNVYDDFMERYDKYTQKRNLTIITKIRHYKNNYIFGTEDPTEKIIGEANEVKVGGTDKRILHMLSKNSRMPTIEIAKSVGVAPNTVKNRIKHLKKKGVIKGFRAKINTGLLGYRHYKVCLDMENMAGQEKVIQYLKTIPNLIYITEVIGESDLEFEVMFRAEEELSDFLKRLRTECMGLIRDYEIILTFYEHQVNYLP